MRLLISSRCRRGIVRGASLVQDVTDQIIKFAGVESLSVVARHGLCSFSLDRHQAGFHEQVKSAISILQLQRGVVLVADHAGKPSAIPRDGSRSLLRASGWAEDRFTNLTDLMSSCKLSEVFGHELSAARYLMTSGAAGLSEEKIAAADWISVHGGRRGVALPVSL